MGKIRMTVAQNAELAQSYIAHARSSGRCSPRRSSRGTRAMLASFGRASLPQPRPPAALSHLWQENKMPDVTVTRVTTVALLLLGLCPLVSAPTIHLKTAPVAH